MTEASTQMKTLPSLVELLEAGVHFGHDRSKQNPKMKSFIFMQRNRVCILDLEQTLSSLKDAATFLQQMAHNPGKEILFVGTKRQAREAVKAAAKASNMPYVTKRWLGGTLTNFSTILKSIEKLDELKASENSSDSEKMTKKEQAVRRKEISRLEAVLEGMKSMRTLPAALVVVGAYDEKLAIQEAKRVGIPVVGIVDTNANPDLLDYPIPANDDAVRSVSLIVDTLSKAILAGRSGKR